MVFCRWARSESCDVPCTFWSIGSGRCSCTETSTVFWSALIKLSVGLICGARRFLDRKNLSINKDVDESLEMLKPTLSVMYFLTSLYRTMWGHLLQSLAHVSGDTFSQTAGNGDGCHVHARILYRWQFHACSCKGEPPSTTSPVRRHTVEFMLLRCQSL